MTNLFEETVRVLAHHNKFWKDISWVGGNDFYIDLATFINVAKETNYDNGFGAQEIAEDLVIAFNDGSWLSREEYDGSEGWRYNYYPQKPSKKFEGENCKLRCSEGCYFWGSLSEINFPHKED